MSIVKCLRRHQSINFSNFQKSALSDLGPSPEHSLTLLNCFSIRQISRNRVPTCFSCLLQAAILSVTYFQNFDFWSSRPRLYICILKQKSENQILFEIFTKQNFQILNKNRPMTFKNRSRSLKLGHCI